MSDLWPRLVTAGIGIPVLLALIYEPSGWGFSALVGAASAGCVWEYCTMVYGDEAPDLTYVAMAAAVGVVATQAVAPAYFSEALMGSVVVVFSTALLTFEEIDGLSHRMNAAAVSVLYGGALMAGLVTVHGQSAGSDWIVLTLVTVWMSDTGAYFIGSLTGNHPLAPTVSPNKSIEGAIGGVAGSVAGAFACNYLLAAVGAGWTALTWWVVLVVALPANLLAQAGDLCESLVKRAHDVDDSGSILYGHGGLLDRIDGLIFASPWFYVCALYLFPHAQA